jgi:two-component system chemotaxis sensor kinase CheA
MTIDAATRARLVGLFVAEAEETVEALRGYASALRGGDTGEALTEFGRVAHGLKGAAAALGYTELAGALHDLEDLALGLRGEAAEAAAARHGRIASAIELLGEGVARMQAASADAFPADVFRRLQAAVWPDAVPAEAPAAAPAAEHPSGPASEPAAPSPAAPAPVAGVEERSARAGAEVVDRLSVPAADVDEALRLAASVARSAAQLHEALGVREGALATSAQALAGAASGLEGIIASLRLIPADIALAGLDAEVSELAARLGKQVSLSVGGRAVRADRRTLQTARGLLRHLVRNALDHGVEPAPARVAAGKPATGRLAIGVEAVDSTLRVEVADDGAGFDVGAIRAELARRGDRARVDSLSDEEVLHHWAFEGGSTRARTTDVSGRGMGLSAVAQLARAAGGGIQVRSVRGLGSTVTFALPLEVYAVEALVLGAAGRSFALPIGAIERSVHLESAGKAVHDGPTGRTLAVGESILPLVALAEAVGAGRPTGRERFALVVRAEGGMAAVAVDDVGAVTGLVPTAVPGVAQADALVTGLARLADGTPVALLNPRLLLVRARGVRIAPATVAAPAPAPAALDVVLAEDSLATREVLRVLLEEQGFRVRLAGDGEEALQRIGEALPDVLVSDVNMPRRDGLSLTRALRARGDTHRLPIVLLTSQDDAATRTAGAAAGADAYLIKSQFNASVLQQTLARLGVRAS